MARGVGHARQGACMVGGVHGGEGHAWQGVCMGRGHVWWGTCMAEACMSCMPPTLRDTVGQCTGGTHPTGMHSCLQKMLHHTLD